MQSRNVQTTTQLARIEAGIEEAQAQKAGLLALIEALPVLLMLVRIMRTFMEGAPVTREFIQRATTPGGFDIKGPEAAPEKAPEPIRVVPEEAKVTTPKKVAKAAKATRLPKHSKEAMTAFRKAGSWACRGSIKGTCPVLLSAEYLAAEGCTCPDCKDGARAVDPAPASTVDPRKAAKAAAKGPSKAAGCKLCRVCGAPVLVDSAGRKAKSTQDQCDADCRAAWHRGREAMRRLEGDDMPFEPGFHKLPEAASLIVAGANAPEGEAKGYILRAAGLA